MIHINDEQYNAICEVIDRAKMDDRSEDTDVYASGILEALGMTTDLTETTKAEVKAAMDVLKAAGCPIDTKMDREQNIVFVVYVALDKMEDL